MFIFNKTHFTELQNDEIDQMLFDYFEKEKEKESDEVPLSTHIAIQTAFEETRKRRKRNKYLNVKK